MTFIYERDPYPLAYGYAKMNFLLHTYATEIIYYAASRWSIKSQYLLVSLI